MFLLRPLSRGRHRPARTRGQNDLRAHKDHHLVSCTNQAKRSVGFCSWANVSIQVSWQTPCLPVRHPTRLSPQPVTGPSPVDWNAAFHRFRAERERLWMERDREQYGNPQREVDQLWQDCQELVKSHRVACATCEHDDLE